jgi:hypothetical protein
VDKGVDLVVFLAQDLGVVGVGGQPFEAEEQDMLQGQGVGVRGRVGLEAVLLALGHQVRHGALGLEGGRPGRKIPRPPGGLDPGLELFPERHGAVDQAHKALGIEVHIGEGGKGGLAGEDIDLPVADANLVAGYGHLGQTLQGVNQQVLERRHFGVFAAHPQDAAAFALGCLLALITKHGISS